MSETGALLCQLVALNSVNPSLAPDGPGESAMACLVREWCEARNLETYWLEPIQGRPSVVAIHRGSGGGRSLMLNAHLDTVGVAGMMRPFEPQVRDGRLYGRGAIDMKSGLAAALTALDRARHLNLRGDVLLAAVADEEHGSLGTESVLERYHADAAILTEPTDLNLHVAHRGFAVFEITTHGRASHTSQPASGINAITHMGRILHEIDTLSASLQARAPHPLLGHGSAQAVLIGGGLELFTTPDTCRLHYERRTLPGESLATIQDELQACLEHAAMGDPNFQAELRLLIDRQPYEVAPDEDIVRLTRLAATARCNRTPRCLGAPYWMDAALIAAADIPTVVFGPTGGGLHATEEWVELQSVDACADVLLGVIEAYCG